MKTRFHLYTVPGQSYYNASRRLVLQGVDGVVFVADSQITRLDENVESYLNLWDNLLEQGDDLSRLGLVTQMNKRDLSDVFSVGDLHGAPQPHRFPDGGSLRPHRSWASSRL